jgi:RNA polymerase subunit RPABC4/transcription elongation factor Spt4
VIEELWNNEELTGGFDIIIDDGSHEFEDTCIFFENSIHKLNKNGYYIIEDFQEDIANKLGVKIKNEWSLRYIDLTFTIYDIANKYNPIDNRLLVIHKV